MMRSDEEINETRKYLLIVPRPTMPVPQREESRLSINTIQETEMIKQVHIPQPPQILDFILTDKYYSAMIKYLTLDILPDETRLARKILLQKEEFVMENDILYHIYTPTTRNNTKLDPILQTVIPTELRKDIF
jgi:hypothetical protein